jgi:hypothetical protein
MLGFLHERVALLVPRQRAGESGAGVASMVDGCDLSLQIRVVVLAVMWIVASSQILESEGPQGPRGWLHAFLLATTPVRRRSGQEVSNLSV